MKSLLVLFFIFIFINVEAQEFSYSINKKMYDSLSNIWLPGIIYFGDGESEKGWIHRVSGDDMIQVIKNSDSVKVKTFGPSQVLGFSVHLSENDTLWYAYIDVNPDKYIVEFLPLQLVEKGEITLFRYDWLFISSPNLNYLRNSDYLILSYFFIWNNQELIEIRKWRKDLLPILFQKEIVEEYFKSISKKKIRKKLGIVIEELVIFYNNN